MSQRALLLGLLALVIGFGAGFLVGRTQGAVPASTPVAGLDEAEVPGSTSVEHADSVDAPAAVDASTPPTLAGSGDDTAHRDALDVSRVGTGVIRGVIRLADGTPVPGVVVTAVPSRKQPALIPGVKRAPATSGLGRLLKEGEREARFRHAYQRRAQTDESGAFELTGLIDARFRIEPWKKNYSFVRMSQRGWWGTAPGTDIDFTAEFTLQVVVHPEGVPGGGAAGYITVRATAVGEEARRQRRFLLLAPMREISLPPGNWTISGTYGEDEILQSAPVTLELSEASAPAAVTLLFRERIGITGRIPESSDVDPRWLRVCVQRFEGRNPPKPEKVLGARRSKRLDVDRRAGTFRIFDLEPGNYVVVAGEGRVVQLQGVVEVSDGMAEVVLEPAAEPDAPHVLVDVFGPGGEALRNVQFSLRIVVEGGMTSAGGAEVLRRNSARHAVGLTTNGFLTREALLKRTTKVTITAHSAEYGELSQSVDPRSSAPVTFRFKPGATLELTVRGFKLHDAWSRATWYLLDRVSTDMIMGGSAGVQATDAESVTFKGCAASRFAVALHLRKGRASQQQIILGWVELESGVNKIVLDMPELHTVTFPGAESSVVLTALDADGDYVAQFLRMPEDGVWQATAVPAGRYRATTGHGESLRRTNFDVPRQTEVSFGE